jgi:hypothetical protein
LKDGAPDYGGTEIVLELLPVQVLEDLMRDLTGVIRENEPAGREKHLNLMIEINRELQRRGKLPALASYKKGET